jgi:esterase/lipase
MKRVILNKVDEFKHVRGTKVYINKSYLIDEFKKNIQIFINICRIEGIILVLMTQANRLKENADETIVKEMKNMERDYQITYKEFKEIYDLFNQTIREIGAEKNLLVIDLARVC